MRSDVIAVIGILIALILAFGGYGISVSQTCSTIQRTFNTAYPGYDLTIDFADQQLRLQREIAETRDSIQTTQNEFEQSQLYRELLKVVTDASEIRSGLDIATREAERIRADNPALTRPQNVEFFHKEIWDKLLVRYNVSGGELLRQKLRVLTKHGVDVRAAEAAILLTDQFRDRDAIQPILDELERVENIKRNQLASLSTFERGGETQDRYETRLEHLTQSLADLEQEIEAIKKVEISAADYNDHFCTSGFFSRTTQSIWSLMFS